MQRNRIYVAAILLAASAGCAGGGQQEPPRAEVVRTDFVETLEAHLGNGSDKVVLELGAAHLHGEQGWVEVESTRVVVDLLSLQEGETATYQLIDPPPGTYDRVRIDVSEASAVTGDEHLSLTDSGDDWIEIEVDLSVPDCGPARVVVTIDIDWSSSPPRIHIKIELVGDSDCVDASAPDAAAPDAGTPDASPPDAAMPDAAAPDAAVPDAAMPDAAPVEDGQDVADAALFRVDTDDVELYALGSGNIVAYGTGDGTVVAPDGTLVDGAFPDPGFRAAVFAPDAASDVIVGAYDGLHSISEAGDTLWSWRPFACCNDRRLPAAVDPATGQAYWAANQRVYQRVARTGADRGATSSHGDTVGYVALAPGLIWKAGPTGRVTLYNRDADLVGAQARFTLIAASGALRPPAVASDSSAVVATGGGAYAGIDEPGELLHVTTDRAVSWRVNVGAVTPPVIGAGDVVFVGTESADGSFGVAAYSLAGASLWSATLAERPSDLLVGDDGLLYVAAGTEIVGLDQATGERQLRFYGLAGAQQMLLRDGTLYVSDTGALFALPVPAGSYDAAAPWPVRFGDNQRTSSL